MAHDVNSQIGEKPLSLEDTGFDPTDAAHMDALIEYFMGASMCFTGWLKTDKVDWPDTTKQVLRNCAKEAGNAARTIRNLQEWRKGL
jgi:hypothetical protein